MLASQRIGCVQLSCAASGLGNEDQNSSHSLGYACSSSSIFPLGSSTGVGIHNTHYSMTELFIVLRGIGRGVSVSRIMKVMVSWRVQDNCSSTWCFIGRRGGLPGSSASGYGTGNFSRRVGNWFDQFGEDPLFKYVRSGAWWSYLQRFACPFVSAFFLCGSCSCLP